MLDGGLWRSSSLDIAKCEAKKRWPQVAKPDAMLSLGTGYQKDAMSSLSLNTIIDRALSRVPHPTDDKGVSRFLKRIL